MADEIYLGGIKTTIDVLFGLTVKKPSIAIYMYSQKIRIWITLGSNIDTRKIVN